MVEATAAAAFSSLVASTFADVATIALVIERSTEKCMLLVKKILVIEIIISSTDFEVIFAHSID